MKYNLVKEGVVAGTHDFGSDAPPALAAHKGKWLPQVVIDPPYDPEADNRKLKVSVGATSVTHEYIVTPKPPKSQAELNRINNAAIQVELAALDLASLRGIREWVASQPTAPQRLKDTEAQVVSTRSRFV